MRIVRVLFGSHDGVGPGTPSRASRRAKLDFDISQLKQRFVHPWTMLTYGDENTACSRSHGFDTIQVWGKPCKFDILTETYIHKLDAVRYALENLDNEVILLDIDCLPVREFRMDELVFKENFSACLMKYAVRKCWWRQDTMDARLVPNGGFLYFRGMDTINGVMKAYGEFKAAGAELANDEPIYMKYIDDINGGWIGREAWFNRYEPVGSCCLHGWRWHCYPYRPTIFRHYFGKKEGRFKLGGESR